ncbi:MAG: hypothetical protein ACJ75B_00895 [Flavisolibacter sp.]
MNRTDDQGNPIGPKIWTSYFIYLECPAGSLVQIDSVKYGNQLFSAALFKVERLPEYVGNQQGLKGPVTLQPAFKKELWKLELNPMPGAENKEPAGEIRLSGKINGHHFSWKTNNITNIEPEASY